MLTPEQKKQVLDLVFMGLQKNEIARILGIAHSTISRLLATRKRVLVLSDMHCGHLAGLTPPEYQKYTPETDRFRAEQEEKWDWYEKTVKYLNADIVFLLGDMTEGKGYRSGGVELIARTWEKQVDMACQCIDITGAKTIIGVYGTPYHSGEEGDDYEKFIARMFPNKYVKFGGHEFPKVHDIQFDLKHKIGSSSIPHGRYTALAKSRLWNQVWKDIEGQPKSDVILRGHVHYFDFIGDHNFLAVICPALQGWGSIYGVRQCEGIVNTGLIWFDIYDGTTLENLIFRYSIPDLKTQRVQVRQL